MTEKSKNEPKKGLPCSLPMSDAELRKLLTPEQYRIMRQNGTETAFQNAFWNNKKPGIYVDAISGEPLFSSTDKFDSGTGWPSFFQPIEKNNAIEKPDSSYGMDRMEVRSQKSNSHLGHVFPDGPKPTGLRYCINSASLQFIPSEDLEKKGYGQYTYLFSKKDPPKTDSKKMTQIAVFGAGCFWGVQSTFENLPGVLKTTVGYTGGTVKNPTYEQVCTHTTGHAEAVQIEFDPSKISYEKLLDLFWSIHDPTTLNRQGPDVGNNYRSVIFYQNAEQEKTARVLKEKLQRSGKFHNPVVTEISPAKEFYKAEEYHQQYYQKKGLKPICRLPKT
ncbi:MAG TPA: bifunctional methionine sulfoxide reductase B/A protein [Candidatus Omnitrophota bacterium]|nr:bifunctional methionine sulfoxide reductase B/A protein [Candidatus Omnitrophota bacterium]